MNEFDPAKPATVHDRLNDRTFGWKPETITVYGVGDVFGRDPMPRRQAIQGGANLGLRVERVVVQLGEPLARIAVAFEPGPLSRKRKLDDHHAALFRPRSLALGEDCRAAARHFRPDPIRRSL
jgi:hypothetical protein